MALCLCFGFAFGIVYGSIEHWSEGFWLTDEMIARLAYWILTNRAFIISFFDLGFLNDFRGRLRALWVGVLIALPSGAGVALSVHNIYSI